MSSSSRAIQIASVSLMLALGGCADEGGSADGDAAGLKGSQAANLKDLIAYKQTLADPIGAGAGREEYSAAAEGYSRTLEAMAASENPDLSSTAKSLMAEAEQDYTVMVPYEVAKPMLDGCGTEQTICKLVFSEELLALEDVSVIDGLGRAVDPAILADTASIPAVMV